MSEASDHRLLEDLLTGRPLADDEVGPVMWDVWMN